MSERRKPSTRFRGERPPKRQASSSPPGRRPLKQKSLSPMQIDEEIPTKLNDGQTLPTSSRAQTFEPSSSNHQSISESGVLAASLERSRLKWLTDGLFEKYWIKRSKKKNAAESQVPPKESMSKIGACSMTIEPHVFEVMLYGVKNKSLTFLPPVGQQQIQGTTAPSPHTASQNSGSTFSNANASTGFPTYHSHQQPSSAHSPSVLTAPPETPNSNVPQPKPVQTVPPQAEQSTSGQVMQQHVTTNESSKTTTAPPKQEPATNADPVIQMLAARAATDHDLKSLMKIVALGNATQPQLRVFQNHIDELNAIIKSQARQSQGTSSGNAPKQNQVSSVASLPPAQQTRPTTVPQTWHHAPAPSVKQEPLSQYYSQPPPYIKPRGPTPAKFDLSAVVFDLNGGNGDRYLIPKNSIIEYLPGNTQAVFSFLITRDGSQAEAGKYKTGVEYYQPVTIRLSSHQAKILEPLSRVLNRPEDVRAHMIEIMTKMTLAEDVHLIIRLPRATEEEVKEKEVPGIDSDENEPKAIYDAPDSLLPLG